MFKVPEQYRLFRGILASTKEDGNNGMFLLPHPKIAGYGFAVQVSDGLGWEHASVSITSKKREVKRCPTWEEMCYIKEMFWDDTDMVVQIHPPKKDYVNDHPYCLHLWRSTEVVMPKPDPILVGITRK